MEYEYIVLTKIIQILESENHIATPAPIALASDRSLEGWFPLSSLGHWTNSAENLRKV